MAHRRHLILLASVLLLASCSPAHVTPEVVPSTTIAPAPPTVQTVTPRPSPTRHTPAPSLVPSPTLPTISPTAVEVSKLSLEEIRSRADFTIQLPDCHLPCWNGLTPGVSTVSDLQGFFARLGMDIRDVDRFSLDALGVTFTGGTKPPIFGSGWPVQVTLKEDKVDFIEIESVEPPTFLSVRSVINNLGRAPDIYLGEDQYLRYEVLFNYPELRTGVVFSGADQDVQVSGGSILACLHSGMPASVFLYSADIFSVLQAHPSFDQEIWIEWPSSLGQKPEQLIDSILKLECVQWPS